MLPWAIDACQKHKGEKKKEKKNWSEKHPIYSDWVFLRKIYKLTGTFKEMITRK